MTCGTIERKQEMTLHIRFPPLAPQSPSNSLREFSGRSCVDDSSWGIGLCRDDDKLSLTIDWNRDFQVQGRHRQKDPYMYHVVHLVPRVNTLSDRDDRKSFLLDAGAVQEEKRVKVGEIEVDKVFDPVSGMYCFDLVLTSDKSSYKEPPSNEESIGDDEKMSIDSTTVESPTDDDKTPSCKILSSFDTAPLLKLKDDSTADVKFMFTKDRSYSCLVLKAHSDVLTRTLGGAITARRLTANEAAEGDTAQESFSSSPSESPVIVIDDMSLATFCVVLYYLYTGKILLSVDLNHFLIEKSPTSFLVGRGYSTSKTVDTFPWSPLDLSFPWRLKKVEWCDLLRSADFLMVEKLRARCLEKVIEMMDLGNVLDMLFELGVEPKLKGKNRKQESDQQGLVPLSQRWFPEVRQKALEMISMNHDELFVEGRDPFKKFADRKECHAVLVELLMSKNVE